MSADFRVARTAVRDVTGSVDRLGFAPYVAALASFLTADETKAPLTVSIEGPWGSGKSTFMNLLRKQLRAHDVKIVDFNAWRYEKSEVRKRRYEGLYLH